ncbi:hypothetical protein QBC39DRAFT_77370 [Podospora conica]|nr:hypothetical protein QBC39DRAFT_77370 [Schizothecium conicum]
MLQCCAANNSIQSGRIRSSRIDAGQWRSRSTNRRPFDADAPVMHQYAIVGRAAKQSQPVRYLIPLHYPPTAAARMALASASLPHANCRSSALAWSAPSSSTLVAMSSRHGAGSRLSRRESSKSSIVAEGGGVMSARGVRIGRRRGCSVEIGASGLLACGGSGLWGPIGRAGHMWDRVEPCLAPAPSVERGCWCFGPRQCWTILLAA